MNDEQIEAAIDNLVEQEDRPSISKAVPDDWTDLAPPTSMPPSRAEAGFLEELRELVDGYVEEVGAFQQVGQKSVGTLSTPAGPARAFSPSTKGIELEEDPIIRGGAGGSPVKGVLASIKIGSDTRGLDNVIHDVTMVADYWNQAMPDTKLDVSDRIGTAYSRVIIRGLKA